MEYAHMNEWIADPRTKSRYKGMWSEKDTMEAREGRERGDTMAAREVCHMSEKEANDFVL
jgi:hypothetical protein